MSENNDDNVRKIMKRKKKRSAAQMAKKFARRRNQGHGSELELDSYQYMVHVLEIIRQDLPTMEDKEMFVNNVYKQTVGHEVDYARNQVGSRVLDSLMQYASLNVITKLTDAFSKSLRPMCSDRFASHVLQKIIITCADRGNLNQNEDSEQKGFNDVALKLCKYVLNNAEEFVWDTYANHVLRTAIECLGGLIEVMDKKSFCFEKRRKMIDEYTKVLMEYCNIIKSWPQIQEFGHEKLTSAFLQSILYSLKDINAKLSNSMIKTISVKCFTSNDENTLSNVFKTESSIRLLEACLLVAGPKQYTHLYESFFVNKLKELSLMKSTNFCIQRLLDHCQTKEEFEKIFDEISKHLGFILQTGHTGIFASLANACLRLRVKQGPFLNNLCEMLHCFKPEERQLHMVFYISRLNTYEQYERLKSENDTVPLHLHGSLVLQAILKFNKPIKVIKSLFAMNNEELVTLFNDPKGSRILDAFIDSQFVGEKSREKLVRKLKGCWAELACGVHGSRSLDKIWQGAQKNQKMVIMEELATAGESLRSTKFGKLIYMKLNVPLFSRNKKDWLESQGKEEKTKALFADIIGSGATK